MKKNYFHLKAQEFKEKFRNFLQQKKKIKALKNFASCHKFEHKNYLPLLESCFEEGFLEEKEEMFLEHLVEKYELRFKYLLWCHNTKSLQKEKMRLNSAIFNPALKNQLFFDLETKEAGSLAKMPLHLLAKTANSSARKPTCT